MRVGFFVFSEFFLFFSGETSRKRKTNENDTRGGCAIRAVVHVIYVDYVRFFFLHRRFEVEPFLFLLLVLFCFFSFLNRLKFVNRKLGIPIRSLLREQQSKNERSPWGVLTFKFWRIVLL